MIDINNRILMISVCGVCHRRGFEKIPQIIVRSQNGCKMEYENI
jgi:hypothetical protein